MKKRLETTLAKIRRVRAKFRDVSEQRARFYSGYHHVVRELTELARRSLRRRRYGDG